MDDPPQIDGILGLAQSGVSASGAKTPMDDLVAQGHIDDVFAICLPDATKAAPSPKGQLYLGSDDSKSSIAGVSLAEDSNGTIWTPIQGQGFYSVHVTDLLVGGVSVGVSSVIYNRGGALVDSGTAVLALPKSPWAAATKLFSKLCHSEKTCVKGLCDCRSLKPLGPEDSILAGECFPLTEKEVVKYPNLEIEFAGGGKVRFPPTRYLRTTPRFCSGMQAGWYTVAIQAWEDDKSGTILGDSFMFGNVVVHDRQQKRMGFRALGDDGLCP